MEDELFRVLLDLWMVCDPWPLGVESSEEFEGALHREALRRNFPDIVGAYHEFKVREG